jgi:hypothetical protein
MASAQVADGVEPVAADAGHGHVVVDDDRPARVQADGFQADALAVGCAAGRDDDLVRGNRVIIRQAHRHLTPMHLTHTGLVDIHTPHRGR